MEHDNPGRFQLTHVPAGPSPPHTPCAPPPVLAPSPPPLARLAPPPLHQTRHPQATQPSSALP
eukprot:2246828-Heterocapsa_arctica.AAC.1